MSDQSIVGELARRRKSVRRFEKVRFGLDIILECIEVAKEAPSGSNAQPWHFVVVEDVKLKDELREVCESHKKVLFSCWRQSCRMAQGKRS